MTAYRTHLLLCSGTGCQASGSPQVKKALEREIQAKGLDKEVLVVETGCNGFCGQGPVLVVQPDEIFYQKVRPEDVPILVEEHLLKGRPVERLFYVEPASSETIPIFNEIPFFSKQLLVVLKNRGILDPEVIDEYIALDGYVAANKALNEMTPEEIVEVITKSGLRGRGGAGFPTGRKWESARRVNDDVKYILCNADEGDPGAFMDRSVLESDPHSVLEGMIIAARAAGATQGYIYCRAEYPLAVKRLHIAIDQAREYGLLGKDILGSGFNFDIEVFQGAGAFVCGESTALVMSIEGKRGMPQPLPRPRTTEKGLWQKPTVLNNVKTFSVVPQIINKGADWFASIGSKTCTGTAVFALTGKIKSSGLIEVPMGMKLRDIIYDIGGGILNDREFKAVQTGGPSGGCIPKEQLDLAVDFDSLEEAGSMMGSGGMVVLDDTTCMVDIAKYFIHFTVEESCGQCVPCRLGTQQMMQILEDICAGRGKEGDIELLEELGHYIIASSICGLGKSAPNPVLSTIRYFRDEYEAHIRDKSCPALVCKELIRYRIDKEKCSACGMCRKKCPVGAITGEKKVPHEIDMAKCTKCGICVTVCPTRFSAVQCETGHQGFSG